MIVCWITNNGNVKRKEFSNSEDAFKFLVTRELISFDESYDPIMVKGQFVRWNDNPYYFELKVMGVIFAPCSMVWIE
ncbi:hypothetical protein [Nitrosopumilus spindle-shaped virus]|uniref:Uncharacterized protein n=1 Tax=Nitrosopumilus spindle-shaped virus TaxID=2508184 RepID=A0A514K342_9VIRU|nr:hypothetical protein [Nitrosopumilus spindle-shaped virus]